MPNDPSFAGRTIAAVLDRQAARLPDKLALREEGRDLTYGEAQQLAYEVAGGLAELGLGEGDHVLVMLDNHVDTVLVWMGIGVSRCVEIPINTAYKGDMLEYVAAHLGATCAIVEDHYVDQFLAVIGPSRVSTVVVRGTWSGDAPRKVQMLSFDALFGSDVSDGWRPQPSDPVGVLYTSGTTGRSKAVAIPQGHAYASAEAYPATAPDDTVLALLPLFHVGGKWASVYNALIYGATAVIAGQFSASRFWDLVDRFECTRTILVGGMAEFLWKQPPREDDADHTLAAVGIIPGYARLEDFRRRFGVTSQNVYGSTEAGSVLVGTTSESDSRSCGRPRPDIEARLVDADDVEVPRGEVGELLVRPTIPWSMMTGYVAAAEATVKAWRNLWFHTGDTMYQAEDGQYCFVDRGNDRIRRRGENVSSFEVEAQLILRPEIEQAACIGIPHPHEDDEIKAVLVLVAGAQLDPVDLIHDLVERVPYFMVPRFVEIVDRLPVNQMQRVEKASLRQAGITPGTWDAQAAGIRVTRHGLKHDAVASS